jgi:hypothetical protein
MNTNHWIITGSGDCGATLMARWIIERGTKDRLKDIVIGQIPYFKHIVTYREDGFPTRLRHRLRGTSDAKFLQGYLQNKIAPGAKASILDLNDWPLWDAPDLIKLAMDVKNLVSCQIITPGPIGLTVLDRLREAGLKPAKTVLVLNDRVGQLTNAPPRDLDTFEDIVCNHAFQRAIDDGAVTVTMPRMKAAASEAICAIRIRQALEGGIDSALATYLEEWLADMERSFKPILSWLP